MEKAGTPRNRLTRSSAKQVNTPTLRTEKEENLENTHAEDIKQNLRKSRRKTLDFKPKTNGNTSASVEGRKLKNIDDFSDGHSLDGCESEDSNVSMPQRNSPKESNHKTPSISRKSLRTRRSMTPGPEFESSTSKKITRSTSEGKLESLSTPTKRRNLRAKSESKDFVFTPSKTKSNDTEKCQSLQESNSNYNRNSTVRVIDKIVEASEGEETSEDDVELSRYVKKSKKGSEKDNINKTDDRSLENSQSESQELHSKTHSLSESDKEASKKLIKDSYTILESESQDLDDNMSCLTKGDRDIETTNEVIEKTLSELCQESNQTVILPISPQHKQETSDEILQETNETILETPQLIEKPSVDIIQESNLNIDTIPQADETSIEEQESNQTVTATPEVEEEISDEVPEESDENVNIKPQVLEETSDEVLQGLNETETVIPQTVKETSGNLLQEPSDLPQKSFEISSNNDLQHLDNDKMNKDKEENSDSNDVINKDEEINYNSNDMINEDEDGNGESKINNFPKSLVCELDEPCKSVNEKAIHGVPENSDIMIHDTREECNDVIVNIECEHTSVEISSGDGYSRPDEAQDILINMEISKDKSPVIQSDNNALIENDNLKPLEEDSENEDLDKPTPKINVPESKCIESGSRHVGSPTPADEIYINEDSSSEDQGIVIPLTDSDESSKSEHIQCVIEESVEHSKEVCKENIGGKYVSCEEELNQMDGSCAVLSEDKLCKNIEKIDEDNTELNSITINKQCDLEEDEPIMDDSNNSQVNEIEENDGLSNKTEESDICNIQVIDPHTVINSEDSEAIINFSPQSNSEQLEQDPLGVDRSVNLQEMKLNENIEVCEEKETSKKPCEPQSDDKYDHYMYEDGTSSKIDEDSGADSDIYKDISDFGSDKEGKKDGSQFDDSISSLSSEPDSGSNGTEDYEPPSVEGDEEDEKEHNEENVPSDDKDTVINVNNKIITNSISKSGEKLFDTNSPMTYDKALAILNKDRVKKIDDEEFFDMFTQELNRVSEESGSDSDIAIVDEYIMEPEETVKKPTPKPPNPQVNVKLPQRPNNPPPASVPIQSVSQAQQFSGDYNQQVQAQHNHSTMQRMNFPPEAMYHQYPQGMPVNTIRGQVMYNQFAQQNTNMQDSRMYNPHAQPNVTYARTDMYNHSFGTEGQMNYPNASTLRVRSVNAMNRSQPFNNKVIVNYGVTDEAKSSVGLGISDPITHVENQENRNITINAATMTDKIASNSSSSSETSTPILKLLGLDKEKLKLLKQVLGIEKNKPTEKAKKGTRKKYNQMKKSASILSPTDLMSKKMKGCEKKRYRAQNNDRAKKKLLIKQILANDYTLTPSKFEASSSEHSSDETASSSIDIFPGSFQRELSSSSEESIEKKREVNIGNDSFLITFKASPLYKKQRHRYKKNKQNITVHSILHSPETFKIKQKYKRTRDHIETNPEPHIESSPESLRLPKKFKFDENPFNEKTSFNSMRPRNQNKHKRGRKISHGSVSDCSKTKRTYDGFQIVDTDIKLKRKMTQGKKYQEQPTVLKSSIGTFTVDSATAFSHSSDSEAFTHGGSSDHLQELKRGLKSEIAQGRGKLSNLFRQHSLIHSDETKKKEVNEALGKIEKSIKKKKVKKLKKLPVKLLEKLVEEGEKFKNNVIESASDGDIPVKKQKGKKKRFSKVKVKSAALEEDYIPLVTSSATQFGLSRLDKDTISSAARTAADFRKEKLYGSTVKRITNKELMNIKQKQKRNEDAAMKNGFKVAKK